MTCASKSGVLHCGSFICYLVDINNQSAVQRQMNNKAPTQAQTHLRGIRSFVCRKTKLSPIQAQAWNQLWAKFGLTFDNDKTPLDFKAIFSNQPEAPLIFEIGFGDGHSLSEMARNHPDKNFIGVEVYKRGVARILSQIEQYQLSNLKIFWGDAAKLLKEAIPDNSLNGLQLFFADPWPKTRHHKRRIVQTDFVDRVALKLQPGGIFHLATDWEDYARHMMSVISHDLRFQNKAGVNQFTPRPLERPLTKYEQRGIKLGHKTWDLIFERTYTLR